MKIIIGNTWDDMSNIAIQHLMAHMYRPGRINLSITGGTTPLRMYELLVPMVKDKEYFKNVHYYNFDEIPYRAEDREGITISGLREAFFTPANIPEENIHLLDQYNYTTHDERLLNDGGLDMMLIGVGTDGHYCGNMPGTTNWNDKTVRVDLDDEMKMQLMGEFNGNAADIPDYYVTMGPRSVMATRQIVMIANGTKKAEIIKTIVHGKIDPNIPSTLLPLHPNFTLILDKEAASLL